MIFLPKRARSYRRGAHRSPLDYCRLNSVFVHGNEDQSFNSVMQMILRVAVSLFGLLLAADANAQRTESFDWDDFKTVEGFIGLPESEIQQRFGAPDEMGTNESKDATVWTYIVRAASENDAHLTLTAYRQFAFWNGMVASVNTRWFSDEEHVTHIYKSSLDYMADDDRTIARAGSFDRKIFTDSLQISRRDDNLWMADMLRDELESHATLLVGDAGYHMCRPAMELEAKRIEAKFGIDVIQMTDTLQSADPRNRPLQRTPRER